MLIAQHVNSDTFRLYRLYRHLTRPQSASYLTQTGTAEHGVLTLPVILPIWVDRPFTARRMVIPSLTVFQVAYDLAHHNFFRALDRVEVTLSKSRCALGSASART